MMRKSKTPLTAMILSGALFVAGCQASNETIGQAGGAIAGGALGSQVGGGSGRVAATIAGALVGGVIGGSIGRGLDNRSKDAALAAEYNALERGPAGQPVAWQGTNDTYGQVVPQQPYQVGSQNCRRYTHTIYVDGTSQEASGTACRNSDGTWQTLS